jgi:hypothetical protein
MEEYDKKVLLESLSNLKIPFNQSFFNKPLSHYTNLSEEIGVQKVERYLRELLMYYKDDDISNKARILLRKLHKVMNEEQETDKKVCECGFVLLEDYEYCPVCNKHLYTGTKCYYKNLDSSCSIDGEGCKWRTYEDCGKLD